MKSNTGQCGRGKWARALLPLVPLLVLSTSALHAEDECPPELLVNTHSKEQRGCGPCQPMRLRDYADAAVIAANGSRIQSDNHRTMLLEGRVAIYSGTHVMEWFICSTKLIIPKNTWVRAEKTKDNVVRIANLKGSDVVVDVDVNKSNPGNSMNRLTICSGKESNILQGSQQNACYMDEAVVGGKSVQLVGYDDGIDREPIFALGGIANFAIGSCMFDQQMMLKKEPLLNCSGPKGQLSKELKKLRKTPFKLFSVPKKTKSLMKYPPTLRTDREESS